MSRSASVAIRSTSSTRNGRATRQKTYRTLTAPIARLSATIRVTLRFYLSASHAQQTPYRHQLFPRVHVACVLVVIPIGRGQL